MSFFDDLLPSVTIANVRAQIIGYAQGAGLLITNWIVGAIGQQIFESVAATVYAYTSQQGAIVRGFASLDTSTDPGDPDPYDPANVNRAPAPGYLSFYGLNTYSTTREEATFASGTWTFDNSAGLVSRTFSPGSLTLTWTGGTPPSPAPTYTNAPDATIYTNPDGSVTVAAGDTLDLPIVAQVVGSGSSAPAGTITLTTSLVGVTGTNAAAVLGQDREPADVYRARCRQAPGRISLGGPSAAYSYLARTNLDGTPLLNASGAPVAITRVYVSQDSATGIVNVYYATASGAPLAEDVTAANDNITAEAFAVPDAITFGPSGTGGDAANEITVAVAGTAKIRARPGVTQAVAEDAIVAAGSPLVVGFATFPIGGLDQTAGAGVIYRADIAGLVQQTLVAGLPGLYDVTITTPATSTVALAEGDVAVLSIASGDIAVTVVP